ncbi:MAG: hypothetical protein QGI83_21890 [Candidatus Latescibacteria bacterium]|nr:hypothetical protein [Candidatus Latescibacterota bacterium]
MTGLRYREDFDDVRDRLTAWWRGVDIGRPALQLTVPLDTPRATVPVLPEPAGWVTHYSTRSFEYRLNLALRACAATEYLAEAVPCVAPDLGPNCLALYLGCRGEERPGTVWFHPCIESPDRARFEYDEDNFYWAFTRRLAREQLRHGGDRFLTSFPDLIEGLDTLAAMRGTEALLVDLLERPEWVAASLAQITELYFEYYDRLYDAVRDDRGGSHFWAWAPGRMAKLQCDFSAMVSPALFSEFMVPVLESMAARLDHCMYHWDGPGAVAHLDALLAIDGIDMIQWTPGAGVEPVWDRRWWPLYHRILEAGKRVILLHVGGVDELRALQHEFGGRLRQFMIGMRCADVGEAERVLAMVT